MGDALTKLGCGIYGGAMVSYFFNLSLDKAVDLQTYLTFIGIGSISLLVGYFGIWYATRDEKPL